MPAECGQAESGRQAGQGGLWGVRWGTVSGRVRGDAGQIHLIGHYLAGGNWRSCAEVRGCGALVRVWRAEGDQGKGVRKGSINGSRLGGWRGQRLSGP